MQGLNEDELRRNVLDKDTWLHFVYLAICGAAFYLSVIVLFAVAVLQFLAQLFSRHPFGKLVVFGDQLATYQGQLSRYLCFASNLRPFPFTPFPEASTATADVLTPESEIHP